MSTSASDRGSIGGHVTRPPLFNVVNFDYWKDNIKV